MAKERLAYKPTELVGLLGLSRWSVYKLIRENRIPNIRLDGRIIIPKKALEKFMVDQTQLEQRAV